MVSKNFYKGKFYVTFKRGFEDLKKDVNIIIDKLFENDSLILTLSDDEDPTFLFRICITRCDYDELKKQQGLLIDFDNFPSQIVRLLQQCASNNMFLIIYQLNPIKYNFDIVEHNEFKRLVHLSLSTVPATDSEIKQHMAETISNLKKTLSTVKSAAASKEEMLNDKVLKLEGKIHELSLKLSRMEEDKLRCEKEYYDSLKIEKDRLVQEKIQWQKSSEVNTKALIAISQENLNKKDKQIDDLNLICKQLKENILQLENQISDRNQRQNFIESELQKTHIEVATLKARNVSLEKEITEKDKQISLMQTQCNYLEKVNKENSETIKQLNDALQVAKKERDNFEKRLSLSESLGNKNNEAANSAAEQLLKANQIISKQNSDLIEIKEKLLCRTAIALEQEKVIEGYTKEIEKLKFEVESANQGMTVMKNELDNLKEKYDSMEKALKDRDETIKNNNMVIHWLHKKMEDQFPSSGNHNFAVQSNSSTPYFASRHKPANPVFQESDDTINFYGTSKTSSLEDSPQVVSRKHNEKVGLDPKYLQPAQEYNLSNKTKDPTTSEAISSRNLMGKENKTIDLPKISYREKKSSKGTYRATPVSAYFP